MRKQLKARNGKKKARTAQQLLAACFSFWRVQLLASSLVAVLLGRIVLHEALPPSVILAGSLILAGVILITARGKR